MIHFNRPKDKLNLFMKKFTPLVFLSVLLIISGCSSSDSGEIATKTFTTELSETTLSFGNVEVTNTAKETFAVTNTGTEEISISNITTPEGFTVTPSSGSITAGNSKTFTVAFTPTTLTVFSGNMSITSNSTSTASAISVTGTGIASTSAKTYENTIAPIMAQSCSTTGCHSGANPAGKVALTNFTEVKNGFTIDDSWGEIQSGRMPKAGVPSLTQEDKDNLQLWINAGYPSGLLTPANYINDIAPIISQNCSTSACHDNDSPKGNLSLTSYALVKTSLQGSGWTRIENGTMPKNGSLTVSEIAIIKNWIDNDFVQQ